MRRDVGHTLDFVLRWVAPGARVLEVGCGDGALAAELSHQFRMVAIDADRVAIEAARARGVDARVARWPELDEERFDAILFTRSLHHAGDLEASIVRAGQLGDRLLVEDFAWHETDPRLMAIGRAPADHDEHLHTWSAIRQTIARHFVVDHESDTPYLFRWGDDALFDEEARVARELGVPMLGRRIVATLRR